MHEPPSGLIYAIGYPIFAATGVPVNIVAIAILSRGKCGLSKCITCYLVAMAAADLLVVIVGVILNRIIGIFLPGNFLSLTQVCRVKTAVANAITDSSVWLTVAFTFDRFVAICCQKMKERYCSKKSAAAIVGTVLTVSYLKNIPWYFVYEPLYTTGQIAWYCRISSVFYSSPYWRAFSYFSSAATPLLPFVVIVLLNALTVRYIAVVSRVRRALRGISGPENNPDPEMANRRKSIILLFSISGNFILLWLTYIIHYLHYRISTTYTYSGYNDPIYILQETGYMLMLLSCCTNTFIYVVTQKKFREELVTFLKYPANRIFKALR